MSGVFVCDKCGKRFPILRPEGFTPNFDSDFSIHGLCKEHQKLHYRPLTEEMVAEALQKTNEYNCHTPDLRPPYTIGARFVLRLLKYWDSKQDVPRREFDHFDWKNILLELAKEP